MSTADSRKDAALRAIVDGTAVDPAVWADADPTLSELRVLYEIARVHNRDTGDGAETVKTVGEPPPPAIGPPQSRWMHFYLLAAIGRGASSTVYRAWDSRLAREVALKLTAALAGDATTTLDEARRLARIRHPHVVSVLGAEQADGQVGLWMELLKGQTLQDFVTINGPLSASEAALLGLDLCSALAAVHASGLLHRDIKAPNVYREHGGRIVLMDLGAGREIDDHSSIDLAGTPLYMAPEQLAGGPATVQSDLYSLAVLLFFATTGTVPISASTMTELRQAHVNGSAAALRDRRPDLPRAFVEVVDRALSRDPRERFGSASEMERALSQVLAQGVMAATPSQGTGQWLTYRVPAWLAACVAAAIGIGVFFASAWPWPQRGHDAPGVATPSMAIASDQLQIARGFEELAAALSARGRWNEAATQYQEAERVYRINTHPDEPLVALALSKLAWAELHAGQLDNARGHLTLAIAKLRERQLFPYMSVAFTALAGVEHAAGRPREAALSLDSAMQFHARTHAIPATNSESGGLSRIGVSTDELSGILAANSPLADSDADWLPDAIELGVGLNPHSHDSDANGRGDDEEDADGDGIANYFEFGLMPDPTRLIAHFGAIDPERLGFNQPSNRRFRGQPLVNTSDPAWTVSGTSQNHYSVPLTTSQREAALAHGFRMTTRGSLRAGLAFTNVDLSPSGPRFDLNVFTDSASGLQVRLNTSVVPIDGTVQPISTTRHWPTIELAFDAREKAARLLVNGRVVKTAPYHGHSQFLEGWGFHFGSTDAFGKAASAVADFNLAMFVIHGEPPAAKVVVSRD